MRSVRASGKPILAAKCEKSSPIASVAEVKTQAQGRDSTYSRSRSAISNGVNCSGKPLAPASTQRRPASSGKLAQCRQELARCAARRAQLAVPAPAPKPSSCAARSLKAVSISRQRIQKRIRQLRPFDSAPRRAATQVAVLELRLDAEHRLDEGRRADRRGRKFRGDVAQQHLHLAHRPDLAEELRGDIRHLMRLIQDHRLGARQQIAEALVLQRQIREQQVMIHDHDIGGLGIAARVEHMAARELRTFLAEAVLARRGDARPDRRTAPAGR